MDKLTKGRNKLCGKIEQPLASHKIVEDNNEFSDKTDQLQV